MEQQRSGGGDDMNDQQPARRSKLAEGAAQMPQPQPPPPRKCPRCDSPNTKFCYYNNYSLSQPRYFCKTCRRYWTQGGTLRNVPVGGGCRKGKRPKTSSSSSSGAGDSSRSHQPLQSQSPPQPLPPAGHQQNLQFPPHMSAMVSSISGLPTSQSLRNLSWAHSPTPNSLYNPSGGPLSSLPAMQSLSQPQEINLPINIGGGGGANMPIFPGFNFPSMKSHSQPLQIQQPGGFHGMGNGEKNLGQPSRALTSWAHGDNNPNSNISISNFWNNSTSSGGGASDSMAGSSLNPNQWPNFPGYGASP